MAVNINKASTSFRYGITDPKQLLEFLETEKPIGVSFIGRSNVGKSSTINRLFGKNVAQTSKTPGRTRQVNIFDFHLEIDGKPDLDGRKFWLFDLPGYGHASVSKKMQEEWQTLMHTFFVHAGHDVLMLNLQDARHPNQKSDKQFKDYLMGFHHETFLVLNKLDKLKKQKERAALEKLKPQIFKEYKSVKQIYFISAESGQGTENLERGLVEYLLLKEERTEV